MCNLWPMVERAARRVQDQPEHILHKIIKMKPVVDPMHFKGVGICVRATRPPSPVVYGAVSFTIDGAVLLDVLNAGHKIKHYNPRDYHPDITDVNFEVCEQLFRWLGTHKHGFKHRSYAGYLLKMYVHAGARTKRVTCSMARTRPTHCRVISCL